MICEEKRLIETLLEQQRNCFLREREKGDNTPALFIEKNASAVEPLEWKYFLSALRKQATLDAFFPRPLAGSSFLLSSWQEIMGDLQVDVQLRESAIPPSLFLQICFNSLSVAFCCCCCCWLQRHSIYFGAKLITLQGPPRV